MSLRLMAGVWDSGPEDAAELLMLLAIADQADDEGIAWPSVEQLGTRCRMAVDEVVETLERLKRRKWLSVIANPLDRAATAYQLNLDRLLEVEARG